MDCRFANTTLYSYPILDDAAAGYDPAFRRRRVLAVAAGVFLLAGAVCLLAQRSWMSLLCIPVLVVAAGLLLHAYLSGRGNQNAFRGKVLQHVPSRRVAYAFCDEHFLIRMAGEEQVCDYTTVSRWYRGARTVTLCRGEAVLILDRDGFSVGDAEGFCRFLTERI